MKKGKPVLRMVKPQKTARLESVGPCLGVCAERADAETSARQWTKPGAYGNREGNYTGFLIEPYTRTDGVTVFQVFAGVHRDG